MHPIGLVELLHRRWKLPYDSFGKTLFGMGYMALPTQEDGEYMQRVRLRAFLVKLYAAHSTS